MYLRETEGKNTGKNYLILFTVPKIAKIGKEDFRSYALKRKNLISIYYPVT